METKEPICILGAGHQGLAMAGYLALNGEKVNLWNRTEANINAVIQSHEIKCDGIVKGIANINHVSSQISEVISNVVMITTPSTAHNDIAKKIAPFVTKEMIIVLNPGRTFGALQFTKALQGYGVKELPYIAETQTIVYTCRKKDENSATIFALKKNVLISSLFPECLPHIVKSIPECIRSCFVPESDYLKATISNVGMILHCAPVLMNIGWIENEEVNFKYYYSGISKSIAAFLEKLDRERILIAKRLGCSVVSTKDWIEQTYQVEGKSLFESIRKVEAYKQIDAPPTLNTRYIFEDIPNGLVPVENIGKQQSVDTPAMTTIINLANLIYNTDFRRHGRICGIDDIKKQRVKNEDK